MMRADKCGTRKSGRRLAMIIYASFYLDQNGPLPAALIIIAQESRYYG
jgi:hypothetical protein